MIIPLNFSPLIKNVLSYEKINIVIFLILKIANQLLKLKLKITMLEF